MITMDAAVLAGAMKNAASLVKSTDVIPILQNVLLFSEGDTVQIATSDMDCEFAQELPLAAGTNGALHVTVDARRLAAMAGACAKGAQITLEVDDKRLTVKSGRSRWSLPTLPPTDFPRLTFPDNAMTVSTPGKAISAALGRTLWAVSTEQTRYYLNGPLLHGEGGKFALAATNGHALMQVVTETDLPEDAVDVILGPKFARLLQQLSAEADTITLTWDNAKVRARIGAITLTSKVIDGTFPDYRRVIPPLTSEVVRFDPELLRGAIKRTQLIATDKERAVKVARQADGLTLSVTSPEFGTACEQVPAECADGFEAGFSTRYLDQMLEAIGGDSIAMHHADAGAPARFVRVVEDGATCVVMPMRV